MFRPRRLLALLPFGLIVGLAALGVLDWTDEQARPVLPGPAGPPALAVASPVTLVEPAVGAPERAARVREEVMLDAPGLAGDPRPAPLPKPLRVILRGRVHAPVLDPGNTSVTVHRSDPSKITAMNRSLQAGLAPDHSFELEATSLIVHQGLAHLPETLIVTAEHPACLAATAEAPVGELRFEGSLLASQPRRRRHSSGSGSNGFQTSADSSGAKVFEIEFVLQVRALLRGRVIAPSERTLPRARLAIATLGEGGPSPKWAETGWADEEGGFELAVPAGCTYAVVAAAEGFQPATALVDMTAPGEHWTELALERGEPLEGRLRLGDEPAPPGIGVMVSVDGPSTILHQADPGLGLLTWSDGAFQRHTCMLRTSEGGRFAVSGLAPRMYVLRVLALGVPGEQARTMHVGRARAPDRSLEIGPLLAQVGLSFLSPQAGAVTFRLRQDGGGQDRFLGPYVTDSDGQVLLWLPPEAWLEVVVGDDVVGRVRSDRAGSRSDWVLSH